MGHWLLAAFVAALTSWAPTGKDKSQPTTQIQVHRQIEEPTILIRSLTTADSVLHIQYGTTKSLEQCQKQPTILWCSSYKEFHEALTEETIKSADKRVRSNFTYVTDVVDNWNVHSSNVMDTLPWFGDCDDLSTTALDMLARQGQPLDRMWLVLVAASPANKLNGRLDHLIAVVEDDQGRYWVVGDTSRETIELKDMTYRPLVYMSTNDMVWHEAEVNDSFAIRFNVGIWTEGWNSRNGKAAGLPGPTALLPDEVPVLVENG